MTSDNGDDHGAPFYAVVFDFDGTLAELTLDFGIMKDRLADLAAAYLGARPEPGPLPALEWIEELTARIGDGCPPYTTSVRTGREVQNGKDGTRFRREASRLVRGMELEAAGQGRLFDISRPMLASLAARGVKTAIITRNCLAAVATVFPDFMDYCPIVLARECVARVKPDPEHLLTALEGIGVAPEAALMVGDHPMDIETGRRAGTRVAGVATGRISLAELEAAAPDHVASDAAALMRGLEATGLLPPAPTKETRR